MTIRTRFAPSPTGHLHIGGVRTALFSFLYARQQNGKFLLRIEDTDQERSSSVYEKEIIDSLAWLQLTWDNEIIRQSSRLERYKECAQILLEKDLAYNESGEKGTAIKFRIPKTNFKFFDLVRGEVNFDTSLFDDLVIMKSDGFPTYHFGCVVDDHDMEISHVIRGEDHLSNTPRQILIFEALGWKPPKYAHLPLILGPDGSPLSKRHGSVALKAYQEQGYLASGVLNYLALLGWGPDNNQEIFSLEELVKKFSLKKITKSGARFNSEKLDWINAQHIKSLPLSSWQTMVETLLPAEQLSICDRWHKLASLYQSRCKTVNDFKLQTRFMEPGDLEYDLSTAVKLIPGEEMLQTLQQWKSRAADIHFDDPAALETMTRQLAEERKIKAGDLIHPLRFALTSFTVSPGLFELMSAAGKEICLNRVRSLLALELPRTES